MRKTILAASCAAALVLAGCVPVYTPAVGLIITDVSGPIHSNGSLGTKRGEACAQVLLMLIASGDASIQAAARNGGITKIGTIETHSKSYLGVYATFCTIVRGS